MIDVIGNSNLINGGDGNDMIWVYEGFDNTVTGSTSNDSIVSEAERTLFKYNTGDGNDFIEGFNSTSILQIGDGSDTYSTHVSDSDIVVTVGEETITLVDAASLSAVNIVGTEVFKPKWSLNGTVATYGTQDEILITVNGVKSLDGISLNDKVVTVSTSALGTD